jgi:hypothetical protein
MAWAVMWNSFALGAMVEGNEAGCSSGWLIDSATSAPTWIGLDWIGLDLQGAGRQP